MTLKEAGNIYFKDYKWKPFRGGGVWSYEDGLFYKNIELGRFARDGGLITGVTICAKELYPMTPEALESRDFQLHAQFHPNLYAVEAPTPPGSPYLRNILVDEVLTEGTIEHEVFLQKLAYARQVLDSIDTNQKFIDYLKNHRHCSRYAPRMTDYVVRVWKGEAKPFDPVELLKIREAIEEETRKFNEHALQLGWVIE